ncbi:Carboxypeptidase regulatory-like domain-containing protein [Desulfatibacillum alkenivorans DSM 16219]|jgi:carboxypeptidase D|uniref:Carboxypeptidase regulatory-like domain-containing protein n=1 Tax=Desulfatibacillum alkenivorans DSM 16219 TaxID=1121393 RepID=A0A1M6R233_9BACT|nr:M14 family zinc carboxypeptidase [Desulfatibacillum alkenivorans]SHK26417.1 Carboxypeptidase regulatory-like domain-containing protein [Desulfatibacillum alkenivorans DSM 16219]
MNKPRFLHKRLCRCFLFFVLTALLASPVFFAFPSRANADHIDPVFEIKITDISKAQASRLTKSGVNVTNRNGTTIWAYVTEVQFQSILNQGFAAETVAGETRKDAELDSANYTDYPTYAEVASALSAFESSYPSISRVVDIGDSYEGRKLLFLKISDNVDVEEDEPEFKYISTMHGDEKIGTDLMLRLIDHMLSNYGTNADITRLIDGMEIWIMPLMNPDGYTANQRYNMQGIGYDLNRNFPDRIDDPANTLVNYTGDPRPIEVQRIMTWAFGQSSTLSANIHGGALVANYPYDSNSSGAYVYTACDDDDLFIELSLAYSTLNSPMYNGEFSQGITNGADWYTAYGGMQDWNYVWMGCMEITLEVSNYKKPPYSYMDGLWDDNRASLLAYMEWALRGVRGVVTDKETGLPITAAITAKSGSWESDFKVYTDPDVGDYHRILLPSDDPYTLTFSAAGYETKTVSGIMVQEGDAVRLDVEMDLKPCNFNCSNGPDLPDAVIALQVLAGLSPEIGNCTDARPLSGVQIGLEDALYILQQAAD